MIPLIDVPTVAIDYDHKSYFGINEDELVSCNRLSDAILCSSKVIKCINEESNCEIDTVFELQYKSTSRNNSTT